MSRSISGHLAPLIVLALALGHALLPGTVRAVVAPDSVAVLANADVPGSAALAMRYAAARDVPGSQVCILPMPTAEDVTLDEYRTRILEPLRACLGPEREARIAAVVVMRGVPLRVSVPVDGGHFVSITAALSAWRSTLAADGSPLLGTSPGMTADCGGTTCYAARVRSPFSFEPFDAGESIVIAGIEHRPVFATMLHGRSDADAEALVDVALRAETAGGATGEFLLMRGADSARGALDTGYPGVLAELSTRGITDARIVDFDAELETGRPLAAFFTGTAAIGRAIEGNTFAPGALTDNLTSFGAVPENFRATGESQVSIARWVAAGAAGAHGTVDEPLNNCFPTRLLIVDYVDGASLAQAYFGNMPYAYWLNLVVGDPMLAPYARRPAVEIAGVTDGESLASARTITATATPPAGRALASLILYVDGDEVARSDGAPIAHCLVPGGAGPLEILAVARTTQDLTVERPYPAAGWARVDAMATASGGVCTPDAGVIADAGATTDAMPARDAGTIAPAPAANCNCRASGVPTQTPALFGLVTLAVLALRPRPLRARRRREPEHAGR